MLQCALSKWCLRTHPSFLVVRGFLLSRMSRCLLARCRLLSRCGLLTWCCLLTTCGLLARCRLLTRSGLLTCCRVCRCALRVRTRVLSFLRARCRYCMQGTDRARSALLICLRCLRIGMLRGNTARTLRTGIVLRLCRGFVGRRAGMIGSGLIWRAGLLGPHHSVTTQFARFRRCHKPHPRQPAYPSVVQATASRVLMLNLAAVSTAPA